MAEVFVIVGGSRSQVPFIRAAKELGYSPVVFDRDAGSPGAGLADRFFPVSTHDELGIMDACRTLHRQSRIAGILTYSACPQSLRAVARTTELLGLRSFSTETVACVTNKVLMKKRLTEVGLPTPAWIGTRQRQEAASFARTHRSPFVVKPASGGRGSAGVHLAADETETEKAFTLAAEASEDGTVLVEEFSTGREFSVGGIVDGDRESVLVLAEKLSLGPAFGFTISGFSMGRVAPADARWREHSEGMSRLGRQVVSALGITNSFFTVDLLLTERGVLVLEAGVMLDAKIDRLLAFSGVEIYRAMCRIAAGEPSECESREWDRAYALKFMFADRHGSLKLNSRRADSAGAGGFRCEVEWERSEGDLVRPPRSIADTLGWVLCESEDTTASFRAATERAESGMFQIAGERA